MTEAEYIECSLLQLSYYSADDNILILVIRKFFVFTPFISETVECKNWLLGF